MVGIVFKLEDVLKKELRLTEERHAHILERPEMLNQEERIKDTLMAPDIIKVSSHADDVLLYYRLYEQTPVTRKYFSCYCKSIKWRRIHNYRLLHRQDKERCDKMGKMKIWFDEEGDFLEIGLGNKKGHFRDIGNDIWERIEEGMVKGIAILNFKKRTKGKKAEIDLPLKITLEPAKA